MKHTPLPWFLDGTTIETEQGYAIADTNVEWSSIDGLSDEANAEFIVRACNSFDDLLDTLKFAVSIIKANGVVELSERMAIEKIDAAIAKAETK